MTLFKVKMGGQDGVVDRPRVLEGPSETNAQTLGCDEVGVAKGGAMEGDDESSANLFDPNHYTPVGEDDKLVHIGEEREEKDVEDEDPGVDRAPGDDARISPHPVFELSERPLADVE